MFYDNYIKPIKTLSMKDSTFYDVLVDINTKNQ